MAHPEPTMAFLKWSPETAMLRVHPPTSPYLAEAEAYLQRSYNIAGSGINKMNVSCRMYPTIKVSFSRFAAVVLVDLLLVVYSLSYTTTVNMETRSVRSVVSLLAACLVVATAAAQTAQLKVFRGTLVHSRVRTEMEVLEDYLIGFNESNLGRVSSNIL